MSLEKIKNILAEADVQGLIRFGAPIDEYNSEAKMISEKISKDATLNTISSVIWDVFYLQFCTGTIGGTKEPWVLDKKQALAILGSPEQYRDLASKIRDAL